MTETINIASISGGKDSAAMALHLLEEGISYRNVFYDTGWEHPAVYEYIDGPLTKAIGKIEIITPPLPTLDENQERVARKYEDRLGHVSAMIRWIIKKSIFPSRRIRYCTDYLKIRAIKNLVKEINERGDIPVNIVGIRAAESAARAKMPEREISIQLDCAVWRPILSWSTEQVIDIHKRHGLPPNPLYLQGADRVGCWPCIFSRKSEMRFIADNDPDRIALIRDLELDVSNLARARYEAKDKTMTQAPTFFGQNGPSGNGVSTIDQVVAWARTSRGGRQFELIPEEPIAGCIAWGLCDTGSNNDKI